MSGNGVLSMTLTLDDIQEISRNIARAPLAPITKNNKNLNLTSGEGSLSSVWIPKARWAKSFNRENGGDKTVVVEAPPSPSSLSSPPSPPPTPKPQKKKNKFVDHAFRRAQHHMSELLDNFRVSNRLIKNFSSIDDDFKKRKTVPKRDAASAASRKKLLSNLDVGNKFPYLPLLMIPKTATATTTPFFSSLFDTFEHTQIVVMEFYISTQTRTQAPTITTDP